MSSRGVKIYKNLHSTVEERAGNLSYINNKLIT